MPRLFPLILCHIVLSQLAVAVEYPLTVFPDRVSLNGKDTSQGLLVSQVDASGRDHDRTHDAKYRSLDESVCSVDEKGRVYSVGEGEGCVEITADDITTRVVVRVANYHQPPKRYFETDVVPILSRYSCNSSGCHGKAEGQNGFKLSVFGFDPRADFAALVQESFGRRLFPTAPEQSLLLTKATGTVAHGGGARLRSDMQAYQVIRDWIAAGAHFETDHPKIQRVELHPHERVLDFGSTQQLRLIANFDDGTQRDVTGLARFRSNNEGLAAVNDEGLVRVGTAPGHVAIMASFLDKMDTLQVLVPNPNSLATTPQASGVASAANAAAEPLREIDRLVNRRLQKLNIATSPLADDATFLRRVYLDIIGTLPTPSEARTFLADCSPNKRSRLVDELLERPEYATYWSLKWSDTLRVDRQRLGLKNAYAYYKWIRDCFSKNVPLDEFASAIIAADGTLRDSPQGTFYKAVTKSGERSSVLSQVFLGVRLECAQCHHHPFDRISQTDYHGMRAFFEPVSLKPTSRGETVQTAGKAVVKHPKSGEDIVARALHASPVDGAASPRLELAKWMTAPTNPWFAKNLANRTWAHFLGRGLVEPVDDLRATNPPTNPELLGELANVLTQNKFDAKSLIREIVASDAYQRSTIPNATNERDEQNYSRALFKRMDAEVLLDAVCEVTGVPEKFEANPIGIRAIELWDSGSRHYFLKLFGRPLRQTACECERNVDANVSQILHVLNSKEIQSKVSHPSGRTIRWASVFPRNFDLIEEMYLAFYSRRPTAEEMKKASAYIARSPTRQAAVDDLAWSLMNSYEFLFNH